MVIFSRESYARKQDLVNKIISALEDYRSSAYDVLPTANIQTVKEYAEFNIGIMESLRDSSFLYLKSEKKLASYLEDVRKNTKDLVSASSKKL
jgi:hypothetical protein